MNVETLIESLSTEDLRAIFRSMNEDSSGTLDDLKNRVRRKSENLSWKYLLTGVPKESLQRICGANGLRNDLSRDELIDQIVMSLPKTPAHKGILRDWGSLWMRWTSPGQRGRR
jgi:hypothetical protein